MWSAPVKNGGIPLFTFMIGDILRNCFVLAVCAAGGMALEVMNAVEVTDLGGVRCGTD